MQLTRLADDRERGSVLVTALLSVVVMLGLGLALLTVVDTQASSSATERTRDRGFNLAESVLTSEGFVLGRNWPDSTGGGTMNSPVQAACSAPAAAATLGAAGAAGTTAALIQPQLNAAYVDSAYAGATWRVNVCDNKDQASTVWTESTLTNGTVNWDANKDNLLWVRASATVAGRPRTVAGLVRVRSGPVLQSKYGLVSGNVSEDLSTAAAAITNTTVLGGLTSGLLGTNPVVAADPLFPSPASGVTGLRCGLLDNPSLQKTCVTGTIGALSAVPAVNTLVTNGAFTQYPSTSSTDLQTIGQLRAQARSGNTYTPASAGGSTVATAPACTITGSPTKTSVVFLEKVGAGDDYCVIDLRTVGRWYKALVIGSGRVILRGDNNAGGAGAYVPSAPTASTAPKNLFTGNVYALNLQTTDQTLATPSRVLVRIEQGARVQGSVNADGKNAVVSTAPPDFNTDSLVTGLLCPGLLCASVNLVTALGLTAAVDALINGKCLLSLPILGCTVRLPGLPVANVLAGLTSQMSTYGSAIHSDVDVINALTSFGSSGVVPGTFRDLNPTR